MTATRIEARSDRRAAQCAASLSPPRRTNNVTSGTRAKSELKNSELLTGSSTCLYIARPPPRRPAAEIPPDRGFMPQSPHGRDPRGRPGPARGPELRPPGDAAARRLAHVPAGLDRHRGRPRDDLHARGLAGGAELSAQCSPGPVDGGPREPLPDGLAAGAGGRDAHGR